MSKPEAFSMQNTSPKAQSGVVLVIALIVLVAMTLAALALIRSVDTNNLIAGNMAFQQSAVHSGDTGIETGVAWLAAITDPTVLETDDDTNGFKANGSQSSASPAATDHYSWDEYWANSVKNSGRVVTAQAPDEAGNTVSYIIDRLCTNAGPKDKINCVVSPASSLAQGNSAGVGSSQFNSPILVYYRITVRVNGPRNTVSYVQSIVSM
jgi:Tfp pilus assembly protein PilX